MARGRKRKDARRLRNGRIANPTTRNERRDKADQTKVVKEARSRVHGVPKILAGSQDAGDCLGRLCLMGRADGISGLQRDAGRLYEAIVRDWQAAILARRVMSGSDLERTGGHDNSDGASPAEIERYETVKGRYVRARRCLLLAPDHNTQMVIDAVVLDDRPMWGHLGTLRVALNAIAHEFSTELIRAA